MCTEHLSVPNLVALCFFELIMKLYMKENSECVIFGSL